MRSISVSTILLLLLSGCQSVETRRHSVDLDAEVPTLYNELVLDNLAMAIAASDSMPYFGLANQSTATNSRQFSAGATPTWESVPLHLLSVPFMGSDQNQAAIQLTPVADSNRLELLHELFYAAACPCCHPIHDPAEYETLKRYYDAHYKSYIDYSRGVFEIDPNQPLDTTGKPPKPHCVEATQCVPAHLVPGTWPTNYMPKRCWYCVTTDKHQVPKCACVVGNYCDVYVWVPAENAKDLRLLVMAALDIATADLTKIKMRPPSKAWLAAHGVPDAVQEQYERSPDLFQEQFERAEPREIPNTAPPPPVAAPLF